MSLNKSRRTSLNEQKFRGKVLQGRSAKGISLQAAEVEIMAMGADLQFNRPRPAKSRYPVDMETFLKLKKKSETLNALTATKRGSNVISDKSKKTVRKSRGLAMMEAVGSPISTTPVAANASVLSGFAGIPATGWLPPDCTLAVGPGHVLVSVNATVAVYSK